MTTTAIVRKDERAVSTRLARALRRGPLHLAIVLICMVWIVPTLGLLVSSFRPANLVATTGWWTAVKPPFQFTLDNYRQVLTANNMGQSFINSLFIAIPATIIPMLVAAFAAYAFAWMKFPGRDLLFITVVGLLVVPLQMTLVPVLRLFNALGLSGTFLAVWLAHTGYGLPFAVYLLRNFFGGLLQEMFESAYLDGTSPFTAFFWRSRPRFRRWHRWRS